MRCSKTNTPNTDNHKWYGLWFWLFEKFMSVHDVFLQNQSLPDICCHYDILILSWLFKDSGHCRTTRTEIHPDSITQKNTLQN